MEANLKAKILALVSDVLDDVDFGTMVAEHVAGNISVKEVARHLDLSDVVEELDLEALPAKEVARHIDYQDLAEYITAETLAKHVDVGLVAQEVIKHFGGDALGIKATNTTPAADPLWAKEDVTNLVALVNGLRVDVDATREKLDRLLFRLKSVTE